MDGTARGRELALRVGSALVLAPIVLLATWLGGWVFAVMWGAAAVVVLWEWTMLVAPAERRAVLSAGGLGLVLAVALAETGRLDRALILVVMGALASAAFAPSNRRGWAAGGVFYAGVLGIAPVLLRTNDRSGFLAVVFLLAVVWATDIAAYAVGRMVGGPRLAPAISPGKTWSGAIGGVAAAVAAAIGVAQVAHLPYWTWVAGLALLLSIAAQGGDLFESWVKRRFGAKDASQLIPGHGGLMDRLDGFAAAAFFAVLIAAFISGFDDPIIDLLVW